MTIETLIDNTITKAKTISYEWADAILAKVSYGDNLCCDEMKLWLLNEWIGILEEYKCDNFGDNGAITPDYECVTIDEINTLIGKINSLSC